MIGRKDRYELGENDYFETVRLHQELWMFGFQEWSFLPLLPHESVLANAYFTQESLHFSCFLFSAVM